MVVITATAVRAPPIAPEAAAVAMTAPTIEAGAAAAAG